MTQAIYYDDEPGASFGISMKLDIERNFPLTAKKVEFTLNRRLDFGTL